MGEKDLTEKKLEDYPEVFADIMNVLVMGKNYAHRRSYGVCIQGRGEK